MHEFLEVGKAFGAWIKERISKYHFSENVDYITIWSDSKSGNAVDFEGSPQKMSAMGYMVDYALTIDMSKELSMVENNKKGQEARRYFIACEDRLKKVLTKQLPQDYLSALKALVKSEEEKALMQPQVEYYQKVLNPSANPENKFTKYLTSSAIAKDFGMSAQKLNKILNELHIIYKQSDTWYLYAGHEDKIPEYADYIIGEFGQTLKFTEKGREWIVGLLEEYKINKLKRNSDYESKRIDRTN